MDLLNITEAVAFDEEIIKCQYNILKPFTLNALHNDEIRIRFSATDVYTLPHKSFIDVKGKAVDADTGGDIEPECSLTSNCGAFLFSEVRFQVNSSVVDSTRNPGITSTLKGLASYNTDESRQLSTTSWNIQPSYLANGYFHFRIPLRHLLGFAEDYRKVLLNGSQEIILIRSNTDKNCFKTTDPTKTLKINIESIEWHVPYITPSDNNRLLMLQLIDRDAKIQIGFRNWQLFEFHGVSTTSNIFNWQLMTTNHINRPRYVMFALQTDKNENILHQATHFDHCNVRNAVLYINSERFPYLDQQVKFSTNQFANIYQAFTEFRRSYYNLEKESESSISFQDFKLMHPIWCLDCRYQNDLIKSGSFDIRIEVTAEQNFPAKTSAYALVITDKLYNITCRHGQVTNVL